MSLQKGKPEKCIRINVGCVMAILCIAFSFAMNGTSPDGYRVAASWHESLFEQFEPRNG